MDFTVEIKGRTLEYFDDCHIYLVDGFIVPSITQILKHRFGGKYSHVNGEVLRRAASAGTEVHEAIERYCKTGEESDLVEVRNFKFLQKRFGFKVIDNEVPVILCRDGVPVSAGRLDLVLEQDGKIGGADIKRTAVLDKDYVACQLNLYRIAYEQCYGKKWEFLKAVHLRGDTRKYIDLPINDGIVWELVDEYMEGL